MCRVFMLHRSGFYAWLSNPVSVRAQEDQRLLKQIKTFYIASGGTYGSPWIHRDMRDAGESCSVHRVARIMREHHLKAQIEYKRRYMKGGKTGSIASNVLERNFKSRQTESSMGQRYHVRENPRRISLCRHGSGSVFSQGSRLVHGQEYRPTFSDTSTDDRGMEEATQRAGTGP